MKLYLSQDNLQLLVPARFILSYDKEISWTEIIWGCRKDYMSYQSAVDIACSRVEMCEHPSQELLDLCWADGRNVSDVEELLKELSVKEYDSDEAKIIRKWHYLMLALLIKEWKSIKNPAGILENIMMEFAVTDNSLKDLDEYYQLTASLAGDSSNDPNISHNQNCTLNQLIRIFRKKNLKIP